MQCNKYEEINGVQRFKATSLDKPSAYDFSASPATITIPRKALERELRRTIEETMLEGGMIAELAANCMKALDADELISEHA